MNKPIYLGQAILDISKYFCMNFGIITLSRNTEIKQGYATGIPIALLLILKLKILIKTLLMKDGSMHLIMIKMIKSHFQLVKTKK